MELYINHPPKTIVVTMPPYKAEILSEAISAKKDIPEINNRTFNSTVFFCDFIFSFPKKRWGIYTGNDRHYEYFLTYGNRLLKEFYYIKGKKSRIF